MAPDVHPQDQQRYFEQAQSWDDDRVRSALRSRRLAWTVATIASLAAIVAIAAVAALVPLKTVEPFVVTVDRSTGATEIATALTGARPMRYDEAVSKYFLAQYVRLREGWVPAAARANFETVALLSAPAEQRRWEAGFAASEPTSPQTLYGKRTFVDIAVRNIAFVNDKVAQVRFTRIVRADTGEALSTSWIATLTFSYTRAPMAEGDRFRNPLGFQVATYRADPEVTP